MKKILMLSLFCILFSLFILVGCDSTVPENQGLNEEEVQVLIDEAVDRAIDELQIQSASDDLYVIAHIEDDFYTKEDMRRILDVSFAESYIEIEGEFVKESYLYGDFSTDLEENIQEYVAQLVEENELTQDEQIIYQTIALIDLTIVLYGEEEDYTTEQLSYITLLIAHRAELIRALEE